MSLHGNEVVLSDSEDVVWLPKVPHCCQQCGNPTMNDKSVSFIITIHSPIIQQYFSLPHKL
ncbi:hypothetical protein K443DRAFT_4693 [Laccaria amethystina LaAM-08-1]|uniref:Uncharacterized protein n=1 Tax=Laccaria amethystina LaAM-08-1 TaxID=1095629 RepID=A0A0C9XRT3_9AGAR|nr:hypothetical protein K443DRAFT_4693 [Laccaria amethystina LaAM-08-1]